MNIGIYKITNLINGKSYIGQSIRLHKRWGGHKSSFKTRKGNHPILHKAFEKYGLSNFSYEIICNAPRKYLDKLEIHFIKHYKSYRLGYNADKGGKGGPQGQSVYQYSMNGDFIKEWDSITEAALYYKLSYGVIYGAASKEKVRVTAGGFLWRREKHDKIKATRGVSTKRKVCQYTIKGELVKTYDTIILAESSLGGNLNLTRAIKNNGIAGGYCWVYKGEPFIKPSQKKLRKAGLVKVGRFNLDDELIELYDNVNIVVNLFGSSIFHNLNGRSNKAYGFRWKYIE